MLVPIFNPNEAVKAKIHAVEASGIWVESQTMIEKMLAIVGRTSGAATPLFFLPFSSIVFVMASIALPSLSETILTR
jgi:hypothetical protein